jgi:hypothetical protein
VSDQNNSSPGNSDPALESMEQRLHRLEAALASMQDMRALEERVTEKVRQRVQSTADERLMDSKRQPLPAGSAAHYKEPAALAFAPAAVRRTWLLLDMWADLVSIVRMFFDVRYHVAWFSRMSVLILVPAILSSQWWLPMAATPVFGAVLDKTVDLLLAFFLYQALSREAHRYQTWKTLNQLK